MDRSPADFESNPFKSECVESVAITRT